RVFYALGDTRTPALLSVGVSAVTVAACLAAARLVSGPHLIVALAACSAVAYTAGLVVTAQMLRRRLGRVDGRRLLDVHTRILAAAVVAGLAAAAVDRVLGPAAGTGWTGSLVVAGAAVVIGAGLYALGARILRVTEVRALGAALRFRGL
ncbi:MAG: murein biosynthesis integral membrane protein MurJ, partial [Nonomuraea sp.]|nr:murein biosynthesis integral membrane protein MurJ [Nonomuraea sp.]